MASLKEDNNDFVLADGTYHSEFSQQSTITTKWDIYTEKPLNVDCDLLISSVQDASLLQEGRVDIGKILKDMPTKDNASKNLECYQLILLLAYPSHAMYVQLLYI